MKAVYLDCASGASGDMLLGAMFDLGASPRAVAAGLKRLRLPAWRWTISKVRRGAFVGTRVEVRGAGAAHRRGAGHHDHGSRHAGLMAAVLKRVPRAGLVPRVAVRGVLALRNLLAAEGKVHGVRAAHAHLHEVEDLDTVVDVFGTLLALEALGVERVDVSAVTPGTGTVHVAHGHLPVPAPGTAELLRGRTVRLGEGTGELITPTGAALLGVLAAPGATPAMRIDRVGYGAGARDTRPVPNLVRAFLGSVDQPAGGGGAVEDLRQMEALVDDASPQLVEAFLDRARADGALEVWTVAVSARRNRPAVMLCALAGPDRVDTLLRAYFEETGSIGVRVFSVARHRLPRRAVRVKTRWGPLTFKVAGAGAALHAIPEWREIRALAARAGVPSRLVLEEARGAWRRFTRH